MTRLFEKIPDTKRRRALQRTNNLLHGAERKTHLKVVRMSSAEGAREKVREKKAQVAFSVRMLHDNPPGDWYVWTDIFCADGYIAKRVAGAKLPIQRDDADRLHFSGSFMTDRCNRSVERRPEEETEQFLRSFDPLVEEKAAAIMAALSAV